MPGNGAAFSKAVLGGPNVFPVNFVSFLFISHDSKSVDLEQFRQTCQLNLIVIGQFMKY